MVESHIASRRNPRIQTVRRLQRSRRARQEAGLWVAEGVRLAEEALAAGWLPQWALYTARLSPRAQAVVDALQRRAVPLWEVSEEVFAAASATQTPQGILLVLRRRTLPWPEEAGFVLWLDGVRDPGNAGTMLRTAWAAGVEGAVLSPETVDVFNPKVVRAAMGAHFHLPLQRLGWDAALKVMTGKTVFLAAAREGLPYDRVDFRQPLVLVVGGEAEGAGETARAMATQMVHIPMPGEAESLNAAVAAAVLLFEVVRQRRSSGRSP